MTKGWNVSNENLKEIFEFIEKMNPQNEIEKRNKYILELAFVHNLSASAIARLNDSMVVGHGNRSKGEPLTNVQITRIINSYDLIREKKHDYAARNHYHERKNLTNSRQKGEIKKPKICGCCGSKEQLELHHIVPLELGGNNEFYNLLYLCRGCHQKIHGNILDKMYVVKDDDA